MREWDDVPESIAPIEAPTAPELPPVYLPESRINLNLDTPMRTVKPTSKAKPQPASPERHDPLAKAEPKPQPTAEPMPEWKKQMHEKMGRLPKIKRGDLWSRL
jgi:hypothetical protein